MANSKTEFQDNPKSWLNPSVAPWLKNTKSFDAAPFTPPEFDNSIFNEGKPWENKLAPRLTLQGEPDVASHLDKGALEQLRTEGMSAPGSSAWEQLMLQKQGVGESEQRDTANANAASGQQSALSQLATSGGVSGGARERLARMGMTNSAEARQNVARQGVMDRLGIGTTAEQNRIGILSNLPGQELASAGYQTGLDTSNRDYNTGVNQYNIGNVLAAKGAKSAADQATYQEQMKAWAAKDSAEATANSGKGGGK